MTPSRPGSGAPLALAQLRPNRIAQIDDGRGRVTTFDGVDEDLLGNLGLRVSVGCDGGK